MTNEDAWRSMKTSEMGDLTSPLPIKCKTGLVWALVQEKMVESDKCFLSLGVQG